MVEDVEEKTAVRLERNIKATMLSSQVTGLF